MKLGEIVEIRKGKKPALIVSEPRVGFRRLIQIDDLRRGAVLKYCPPATDEVRAVETDIIIAWDGANAATSNFGLSGVIGSTLAVLRPSNPAFTTPYLAHFIRANTSYLRQHCQGATVPHIDGRTLKELRVPKIPLNEQKRIGNILDKADAQREKRRRALQILDTLLQSVFLEMFGDPNSNPNNLDVKPIEDFGDVVTGSTPSRANSLFYGSCIEWIKSDNINTSSHFLTEAAERLSEEGKKVGRIAPAGSTLVTCIAGSPECIGNAALTNREVAFNQQINAIIPNKRTNPYFLYAQVLVGKKLIQKASTNSMKGMVSKGKFQKVTFLAPPKTLQDKFGEIFKKILSLHKKSTDGFLLSSNLFQSLQQRAFKGDLFGDESLTLNPQEE